MQVPPDVRPPHRSHFPGGAGGSLEIELLEESEEVLSSASEDDDDDDPELLAAESAIDLDGTVIVDSFS